LADGAKESVETDESKRASARQLRSIDVEAETDAKKGEKAGDERRVPNLPAASCHIILLDSLSLPQKRPRIVCLE